MGDLNIKIDKSLSLFACLGRVLHHQFYLFDFIFLSLKKIVCDQTQTH